MSHPTISIVGAGIGGLTLGRCLLQRGIRAVLYEKAPSGHRHSYAITLQPSSYRPLLKALSIDETAFKNHVAVDTGNGPGNINSEGYGYRNLEAKSFRANRKKLEDLLREGLDVRWDHTLQHVEQEENRLSLRFANATSTLSDVVVAVDGPHSTIRKQFLSSVSPDILPYVAFNGKRKISRKQFDEIYGPAFADTTVLELRRGGVMLNISINDGGAEEVSVSWIYSRSAQGPSDALHKPDRSNSSASDVPEEFYEEVQTMNGLPQPFADIFDASKLRQERILHWLMRAILVPKDELQKLGEKSIWLIGDAAHAEQIIGGGGANSAIDDGVCLADWITQNGSNHISSWYDQRYPSWQEGQKMSRECIAGIHKGLNSEGKASQHL